jgi:peptidyl-prolyl cis-trans isomerase D
VKLTDDEIKAYYDEHAKEFMTPDQVVIDYLELKKSSFFDQVSVKDEDLQAAYQKETANLSEQRRAAHILIEVNDKTTEAQAKAKIEEIQARLAKGDKFEALAKEFSQDPGRPTTVVISATRGRVSMIQRSKKHCIHWPRIRFPHRFAPTSVST